MFSSRAKIKRYGIGALAVVVCSATVIGRQWVVRGNRAEAERTFAKQVAEGNVTSPAKAVELVGRLPLHFEANKGQTAVPGVDFISHGNGFSVSLTSQGPITTLREVISAKEENRRRRLKRSR